MCLCYLFSAKTAWQLVNRKADFFYKTNRFESIRITNRIDSNRELECSTGHPPLSINISRPPGPQQQTRPSPWMRRKMVPTDRRTNGQTDGHRIVT